MNISWIQHDTDKYFNMLYFEQEFAKGLLQHVKVHILYWCTVGLNHIFLFFNFAHDHQNWLDIGFVTFVKFLQKELAYVGKIRTIGKH